MTNFTFTHRQLRVGFIALLCALFTLPLAAQNREAYVVQSADETTLTFFYDSLRSSKAGTIWTFERERYLTAPWKYGSTIKKMVFDPSFKDFLPIKIDWFKSQQKLSSIEGLENLNTSAVTDMSSMFYGCSGLKTLNLSSFNTSDVTNMSHMFSGCSGLKALNLSSFNTSAVTDMKYMFHRCSGLKELNLSSFNTSAVMDMSFMFNSCSSLTELNLSSFNTSEVTKMGSMFAWSSNLTTIYSAGTWECEKSRDMFLFCSKLKGAVPFNRNITDVRMANPQTGYFTQPKPTAIGRVGYNGNNATKVFTLQGKRVNGNTQHLPAGFYIVNGMKVYLGR